MSHKHLTEDKRDLIVHYLGLSWSKERIAKDLGVDRSTIYRELERNRSPSGYFACAATEKAVQRKRGCPPRKMEIPAIANKVREQLKRDHPPEEISGRLSILPEQASIGRQTIYNWIKQEQKKGRKWHRYLPRLGRPYRKCKSGIHQRRMVKNISERPIEVESRTTIGHWEGDTLEGCKGGGAVISLVERKSRYTVLCRVPNRSSIALEDAVRKRFSWKRGFPRETITVDNGREFSDGKQLSKAFKAEVYFADPYSPWQKGTVEQTNGLLRRYLPKGFDSVTDEQLRFAEDRLNHRPRKCLGFLTPHEVMFGISPS